MVCTKCKTEKKIEEFPFKNKKLNKRSTVCKICQREYKRDHYKKNKEQHYFRNKKQYLKLRGHVYDFKLKNPCRICGESEPSCLDFHHLKDKNMTISSMVGFGSMKKLKEEMKKCVVLCANCHRKVHAGVIKYP